LKEYNKAVEDLNIGLGIKEDDPQVHYRLGIAFYADKNFKDCVKYLK
jgi:hypothetical protein